MRVVKNVKSVVNAFIDGCKEALKEEKEKREIKVEKFDEIKVPSWIKK